MIDAPRLVSSEHARLPRLVCINRQPSCPDWQLLDPLNILKWQLATGYSLTSCDRRKSRRRSVPTRRGKRRRSGVSSL